MTAAAAVDGIREVDGTGSIGIVSTEPNDPYNRPPLSKAFPSAALAKMVMLPPLVPLLAESKCW